MNKDGVIQQKPEIHPGRQGWVFLYFCDKIYIVKSGYQSHMRKKHNEIVQSAKKTKQIKMTKALENSNAECFIDVSKIWEEVLGSITQKQDEKTERKNEPIK